MDRRRFLILALSHPAAVALAEDEPLPDVKGATLQKLIELLDHDRFYVRQCATEEMIDRGRKVLCETQTLPWKNDILPLRKQSLEVRSRLAYVLHQLNVAEARLSWKGTRVPDLPEFAGCEKAPAIEYFSALNAAIGGNLDSEKLSELGFGQRKPKVPDAYVGRSGESFWGTVLRNAGVYTVWDREGALQITNEAERMQLAHDGALCGKLHLDKKGAMIFFLTDPGVAFHGWEILSFEAVIDGTIVPLKIDPERSGETVVTGAFSEGSRVEGITRVMVKIRAWGSPVVRVSINDLSSPVDKQLGAFVAAVRPPYEAEGPDQTNYQHVYCRVCEPNARENSPLPNNSKRFFSSYRTVNGALEQHYPSDWSSYERVPGGAEFLLRFRQVPSRLDVRVPDDRLVNDEERTLTFDHPKLHP